MRKMQRILAILATISLIFLYQNCTQISSKTKFANSEGANGEDCPQIEIDYLQSGSLSDRFFVSLSNSKEFSAETRFLLELTHSKYEAETITYEFLASDSSTDMQWLDNLPRPGNWLGRITNTSQQCQSVRNFSISVACDSNHYTSGECECPSGTEWNPLLEGGKCDIPSGIRAWLLNTEQEEPYRSQLIFFKYPDVHEGAYFCKTTFGSSMVSSNSCSRYGGGHYRFSSFAEQSCVSIVHEISYTNGPKKTFNWYMSCFNNACYMDPSCSGIF